MNEALFVVAVAVVITHRGRVLALRRAPIKDAGAGIWETVSGRLEEGESLEACALREVTEESGLTLVSLRGPIDAYVMRRRERPMTVLVYAGEATSDALSRSEEHDAEQWCTREEVRALMPERLAQAVERALDQK